jgi:hypothetical protein
VRAVATAEDGAVLALRPGRRDPNWGAVRRSLGGNLYAQAMLASRIAT